MVLVGILQLLRGLKRNWGVPWGVICSIGDPEAEPKAKCFAGNLHGNAFLLYGQKPHPFVEIAEMDNLQIERSRKTLDFLDKWKATTTVLDPIMLEPLHGFPEFPTGRVGLGLANYTARFDNLKITGPGIPNRDGLSVTPSNQVGNNMGKLKAVLRAY